MPNFARMRRPAGWVVLGQLGLEVAALNALLLAIATSQRSSKTKPPKTSRPESLPAFITEVSDNAARRYRLATPNGLLYAGFYSDGRVRLAAPSGARFSGVVVDNKVVVAALRDDVSFEMQMEGTDPDLSVRINGGPFDGETLLCEPIA